MAINGENILTPEGLQSQQNIFQKLHFLSIYQYLNYKEGCLAWWRRG